MRFSLCLWRAGVSTPIVTVALIGGLLRAQAPDHYELSVPSSPVDIGDPFPVSLWALDATNRVLTNWVGEVRLLVLDAVSAPPVISEIDSDGPAVEVTNPGEEAVDLSGWMIRVFEGPWGRGWGPRLVFPSGTVLPPGGVLTWSSTGEPPGSFPDFVAHDWWVGQVVRLVSPAGELVDEVYLNFAGYPFLPGSLWRGAGLPGALPPRVVLERMGDANHLVASDWSTNAPSLGLLNRGLRVPWRHTGIWTEAVPGSVTLTNGVWHGEVAVGSAGRRMFLVADGGAGDSGRSTAFEVRPLPMLTLALEGGLPWGFESMAGPAGAVRIGIPAPRSTDLPLVLWLSAEGEFQVDNVAVIPAGQTQVTV